MSWLVAALVIAACALVGWRLGKDRYQRSRQQVEPPWEER